MSNIDDLYRVIDINGDGEISFEEFKQFYEAVLLHTTARSTASLSRMSSVAENDTMSALTRNSSDAVAVLMRNSSKAVEASTHNSSVGGTKQVSLENEKCT